MPVSNRVHFTAVVFLGASVFSIAGAARAADSDLVKRGEYLATMGDCVACHSAPGGEKFAGGLYMQTPFGKISTPNITPDKETGIGKWTDDQFYRAMHEGIDNQGKYLYPVFPFPWFTKVTKDDALAIKAYLFSLKPVNAPRKELKIGFPFNIRTGLLAWRTLFFKPGTFEPNPKASAEINRGAYLVEGLGHCGECHNKSKLVGASDWSGKLQGGQIEGYYAPNLTSDGHKSAGLWSKDEIVAYLKTGSKPDHTSVAEGPMKETIQDSLSHLSDEDLGAIAVYLKSLGDEQAKEAGPSKGEVTPVSTANAYLSHCASCHQTDGKGVKNRIPALAGNGVVTAGGPQSVIEAVLGGLRASHGLAPMPALGQTMTDAEVADAVNYARKSWGNNASADTVPATSASFARRH
jgi:Cytochrome c, mono- and diheme variants